jgi:hypothetical protein
MQVKFHIPQIERLECQGKFCQFFDKELTKQVENGVYNYSKQYCKANGYGYDLSKAVYYDKVEDILYNCRSSNKTILGIIKKINSGSYNPRNLAFLKPNELNEDLWRTIIQRRKQ